MDVSPTEAAVGERLCQMVAAAAKDSIAKQGRFVLAVPGARINAPSLCAQGRTSLHAPRDCQVVWGRAQPRSCAHLCSG